MKINMAAPILALNGDPIIDGNASVLLRTIVQSALLATLPDDSRLPGDRKAKLFALALAANAETVDWPIEDVALVKERVGAASTPLAVGRAYELLDPPAETPLAGDNLHA